MHLCLASHKMPGRQEPTDQAMHYQDSIEMTSYEVEIGETVAEVA